MSPAEPGPPEGSPPDPVPSPAAGEPDWVVTVRRTATSPAEAERRWEFSSRDLRRRLPLLVGVALVLVGSWIYLGVRAFQAGGLERRVEMLEGEREQLRSLVALLEEVEEGYERLRGLFLPEGGQVGALWLPPTGATPSSSPGAPASGVPIRGGMEGQPGSGPPSVWPLTERGFLTQGLITAPVEGAGTSHPGIDVAVPSGSYFRAVGGGTVVERGEDPVYGLFVVVDHGDGYRSLYAHASVITVEPGRSVVAGEVLGLTGSSGRSTAPHLHLEITREGEHVDPLTLLRRP
jgi:murein DD-endopeptidase MepM/ murein hydrolase activator NlpD